MPVPMRIPWWLQCTWCDLLGQAAVGPPLSFSLSLVFPSSKMILTSAASPLFLSWFRTLFFSFALWPFPAYLPHSPPTIIVLFLNHGPPLHKPFPFGLLTVKKEFQLLNVGYMILLALASSLVPTSPDPVETLH